MIVHRGIRVFLILLQQKQLQYCYEVSGRIYCSRCCWSVTALCGFSVVPRPVRCHQGEHCGHLPDFKLHLPELLCYKRFSLLGPVPLQDVTGICFSFYIVFEVGICLLRVSFTVITFPMTKGKVRFFCSWWLLIRACSCFVQLKGGSTLQFSAMYALHCCLNFLISVMNSDFLTGGWEFCNWKY